MTDFLGNMFNNIEILRLDIEGSRACLVSILHEDEELEDILPLNVVVLHTEESNMALMGF